MTLVDAVDAVAGGGTLSRGEARAVFGGALQEGVDEERLGALLRGLAARGETVDEIAGAADALRAAMRPFEHDAPDAVDTCGTGGDGLGSFNLSTASAVVAAASGARVIKHGNRSVSSKCGSADLLEAAGVQLQLTPEQAREVFEQEGITFLFAPAFHPAMRFAAPVRKKLGIRTIFNYLGPLCNPGGVRRHLLGVDDPERVDDFAAALEALGFDRAYVVHGAGGADELTLAGANTVRAVGKAPAARLDATALGLAEAPVAALAGGDAVRNLELLQEVLDGGTGPLRDAVLLNAAAALLAAGVTNEPANALARSRDALDSGFARQRLDSWAAASARAAGGGA